MLIQTLQKPLWQRLTAPALVAYGVLIAWLSLVPSTEIGADKLIHIVAYWLFVLLAAPAVLTGTGRWLWLFAGAIFLYSGSLEVAQALVPGRDPDGLDLLANGTGVAMASVALVLLKRALDSGQSPSEVLES